MNATSNVLEVPALALVVLVGPSGAGKSTFARTHFKPTEIVSSDDCRGTVCDDPNALDASDDAFALLHFIVRKRLARGLLTVVDATSVQSESRRTLVALAREYHVLPVALVFDLPAKLCHERNESRPDRQFGRHVVQNQLRALHQGLRHIKREGFTKLHVLDSTEAIDAATIVRAPLWVDRRTEHGPFDIVGDIHGCADELRALLVQLGYALDENGVFRHADARKAVFLGDLVDRGPDTPGVLRIVMSMVRAGTALCVPGNHDTKLLKKLRGAEVKLTHGLAESVAQLERETPEFRAEVMAFIDSLVSHFVLDDGKLVVAHAGLKEPLQGRGSQAVRAFALYGETTGEKDEYGFPERYAWAEDYRGRATVVYGHTPVVEPDWLNRTMCVDTGCVFGGSLTALQYPERTLASVAAARVYYEPVRPIGEGNSSRKLQHANDDVLDAQDVIGKRAIRTRQDQTVTVRAENAAAALEAMSRFAVDPKWLVYLPPTMSPCATSRRAGLLEHPDEAFEYYRDEGIAEVVCEEKHMGSRAVVVLCRSAEAARARFGTTGDTRGVIYTRTGRPFFANEALGAQVLERLGAAMETSGLWDSLASDWLCLDGELMPWSLKAQDLLRVQYARTGAAATHALSSAKSLLESSAAQGVDVGALLARTVDREAAAEKYVVSYRRYCWDVAGIDDVVFAPFHVMASEGSVHTGRDHRWHMETLRALCDADPGLLRATPYRVLALDDAGAVGDAVAWWEELTARGGEGMVVKPLAFSARGKRGRVQPAVKCRGAEYLRIIYGPEYLAPANLARLRSRGLTHKRSLAAREFALGVEALERFVKREPLRTVHECVFAVLALESEPMDPRL